MYKFKFCPLASFINLINDLNKELLINIWALNGYWAHVTCKHPV